MCVKQADKSLKNFKFVLVETSFSINMPLTNHISISVQALTPKLNKGPFPVNL